jgi:uncharacterized protein
VAKFIVAAISARGFAQAAVMCGHEVVALDAFADKDTRAAASQTFKLKFNENIVDEADFKRIFEQINLTEADGFLYGSLFDNCPDLLVWVARQIRLVGNAPEVLRQAKGFSFFALLDDLKIPHPEVSLEAPKAPIGWLCKQIGGTGGTHIKPANHQNLGDYFQKQVFGTPVSMLFLADGNTTKTIGFNRQFIAPTVEMPYRFAGAVSNIVLPPSICADFEHAALQLTQILNLRGINSLDAVLENELRGGEKLWILELNPRLSATFDLYENLFNLHLESSGHLSGCAGSFAEFVSQKNSAKAQLILYADEEFEIAADFVWPSWAADIPAADNAKIAENAPICSVFAESETAGLAENLVRKRAEILKELLSI